MGCSIFGIVIITLLYVRSTKSVEYKNNFQRSFLKANLDSIQVLDIKYNGYYVAGLTDKLIYLANSYSPDHLVILNHKLTIIQKAKLNFSPDKRIRGGLKITVDDPNIYIEEITTSSLFHGIIPTFKYTRCNLNVASISKSAPIGPHSFILRTYDHDLKQNILQKVSSKASFNSKEKSFFLKKQSDGVFCTDGLLLHDRQNPALIIYVYLYRNQFTVLDTTLNLLYENHTIDTISHANIKTHTISSQKKIILATKPQVVNKHGTIYKNKLYIHSGLLADNEQKNDFSQNSAIDVYSLIDGHYQFSFYIPDYNKKKLSDLKIANNKIIALHDHYLVTYNFNHE